MTPNQLQLKHVKRDQLIAKDVCKTKIRFGFGLLKTEPSNNLTSLRLFSNRNCVQSAIQIKNE